MRIAITGASGFLGRYIARELLTAGHECRGLIRPDSPRAGGKPPIDWVTGSLADAVARRALVAGADAVIHAALDRPGDGFLDRPDDVAAFVDRNLLDSIRLIEAARDAGVGRFVVITSGAVHDVILGDRPLDETHPLWPRSHYGATKAALEAFVSSYGRGEGFPICALRPTSIYGLAEPQTRSRWYDLVAAVVRGDDVDCPKGAKQVHAADVARAAALLLHADGVAGEVYHCTDLFVAERDVAELARSFAATRGTITGDRPGGRHPIECSKLKSLGMTFGGAGLLRATIGKMVQALRATTRDDLGGEGRAAEAKD